MPNSDMIEVRVGSLATQFSDTFSVRPLPRMVTVLVEAATTGYIKID